MPAQELVTLGIIWEHGNPQIKYASIEVASDQEQWRDVWSHKEKRKYSDSSPIAIPSQSYRELTLDDVYEQYTTGSLQGIEIKNIQ